jgi:hypothetical protein
MTRPPGSAWRMWWTPQLLEGLNACPFTRMGCCSVREGGREGGREGRKEDSELNTYTHTTNRNGHQRRQGPHVGCEDTGK